MLGEPQRTDYDWNFELFGIPVRVHPFFWLVSVLMGLNGGTSATIIIWVGVVFVSILVHEFGHAWAIQHFGWTPRVVLHGFGGLAIYDPNFAPWQGGRKPRSTPNSSILISLAGPAAGFAFAAIIVGLLFLLSRDCGSFSLFNFRIPLGRGEPIRNDNLRELIFQLMHVNIFWGLVNLMPIYPLDGGKVARELFLSKSHDGVRQSLQLSIAAAIVVAIVGLVQFQSQYMAFMFGYLGYLNYQQLSGPYGGQRW